MASGTPMHHTVVNVAKLVNMRSNDELREDGPGRTRMTLTDGPYPNNAGEAETGWKTSFEKLAAYLAS